MTASEKQVAECLLKIKAIKLQPNNPFTWASGWHSPIYCDNRKTLSYPEIRTLIRDAFVDEIKKNFPQTELIAGVATGAIAQGALVAQSLGLPFVYVRSSPKDHGLGNLIEGDLKKNQKTDFTFPILSGI
jgi:orotate phosphoribosyltransferase